MTIVGIPRRVDVLGIPLSLTTYDEVDALLHRPPPDRALTVAVCNVHSVMAARKDPLLRDAITGADVATTDGQPLVWAVRALHDRGQQRVYGPELMRRITSTTSLRHYLYGSTEETVDLLVNQLRHRRSSIEIAGNHSPPFRSLTTDELKRDAERILESGADIVWVGLGMPKQELWMHHMRHQLPGVAVIGVGAAFDMLAGQVRQAPPLVQRAGLEWLFRLVQEPRRLWRRYLWNNPAYLVLFARELIRTRLQKSTKPLPD